MFDKDNFQRLISFLRGGSGYFEAQAGSSGSTASASRLPTPKPQTFKTEEDKRNFERTQLNNLCADFGVNINQLQKKPKRRLRVLPSQRHKKGGIDNG